MYTLLAGHSPFYAKTDVDMLKACFMGEYSTDNMDLADISVEAKDLMHRLMCPAELRLSAT